MTVRSSPKYITQQLRKLRLKNKIAQFDFAELTGYDRSLISHYERGKRTPNLKVVTDFADALGHEIVVMRRRSRRNRPTNFFNGVQDDPEIALYYMELGYRGCTDGLSLGEVFRRCPTIKRAKSPPD